RTGRQPACSKREIEGRRAMSEPGGPAAAFEIPREEGDRSLTPPHPHPDSDMEEPSAHGADHAHEPDGEDDEPRVRRPGFRLPFAHIGASAMAKWKRETRFGIAAVVSFVILVTVLIANKGRQNTSPKNGKASDSTVVLNIPHGKSDS